MNALRQDIDVKIKLIEDFIALSLRRSSIAKDACKLMKEVHAVRELMESVNDAIEEELNSVQLEHETTVKRVRQQTAVILNHVLAERRQKMDEAAEQRTGIPSSSRENVLTEQSNGTMVLMRSMERLHVQSKRTPMMLSGCKDTPTMKRCVLNPIPFRFSDYDYQVSSEEFERIPKYMKGRETVDELNHFLSTVITKCFNEKYTLLQRQRSSIRNRHDLDLWKMFNDQSSYVPGRSFITIGDISREMQRMLDKKHQNRLVMLRHLGILREQRISQTACYIWNAKV